ncbi:gamma-glutamyl-gamma-aminobutyrate hydrolase family protein [Ramlibacter sp. PS4R-6]|uniref:gamma-glutamyl-gamma-aminobutyrate hydrolase family protein n=1 Tax=Ramlibacter sp. PS4R-6 TaxID=3133438 RepID=UPI0030B562C6
MARVPVVWVVASHRTLGNEHGKPQMYTVMDEAGTRTLLNMGLQPATFPGVAPERIPALLEGVDGVFLGGSATHVHPSLYGEPEEADVPCYDLDRDAVAQPLVRQALALGVPLLGVCRGAHDFNVALGGSLHQSLRQRAGGTTHWEDAEETLDQQYGERHGIDVVPGGELERIAGKARFGVSSLHSQGINRLGAGLVPEAHAECGLVEAFRWHDPTQFAWGFQFHPEWGWCEHPEYGRIMHAFLDAVWGRFNAREGSRAPLPQNLHLVPTA